MANTFTGKQYQPVLHCPQLCFSVRFPFLAMNTVVDIARGLLGIAILLGVGFVLSKNRKAVNWPLVPKSSGVISDPKSIIVTTYALCGFANFASIGIQIGGIGVIAPDRRVTLSQLGIYSLIGGTIACFLTACIAGMLV